MCMFQMKERRKKEKRVPRQKAKAIVSLAKKFSKSESGQSMARLIQYAQR